MIVRWIAAGVLEADYNFRRMAGYRSPRAANRISPIRQVSVFLFSVPSAFCVLGDEPDDR
jgi:hypothetical protein